MFMYKLKYKIPTTQTNVFLHRNSPSNYMFQSFKLVKIILNLIIKVMIEIK